MVEIKVWAHDPSAERTTFKLLEAKLKHGIMEWWQFTEVSNLTRFLHLLIVASCGVFFFFLNKLLRSVVCIFSKLAFLGNSSYVKIEIRLTKKSVEFKQPGILNSINWLNSVIFSFCLPQKLVSLYGHSPHMLSSWSYKFLLVKGIRCNMFRRTLPLLVLKTA